MAERRLFIVRHGIAEDLSSSGKDADRELTDAGRRKTERAARGLRRLEVEPVHLVSSPLVRARQTADLLATAMPGARRAIWAELACGVDEYAITARLDRLDPDQDVMMVGHEPDLGELLSYWLTGRRSGFDTRFRKGAVACIRVGMLPPAGRGALEWMLTAGQLGKIAESHA